MENELYELLKDVKIISSIHLSAGEKYILLSPVDYETFMKALEEIKGCLKLQ